MKGATAFVNKDPAIAAPTPREIVLRHAQLFGSVAGLQEITARSTAALYVVACSIIKEQADALAQIEAAAQACHGKGACKG